MSRLGVVTIVLAVTGVAGAAYADGPAGTACSAKLTPDGQAIYAASLAQNPTSDTLRDTVEREARSLVMGGKISRGTARDNAYAAGECLKVALQ